MSFIKLLTQIFSAVISLFQFLLYPSTSPVIANLKDVSAKAKTYEEWLLYQEELDALSQRNIWSVPLHSSTVELINE
jgi:hypothetical protein